MTRVRLGLRAGPVALAVALAVSFAPAARGATYHPPFPYRAKECTLAFDGDAYHLFYIRHRMFTLDDSTERDFGHATTTDFVNWTELEPVLHLDPTAWDNFHVWSPQVVRRDSDWAMFYTGVTRVPGMVALYQRLGMATSPDLSDWTRAPDPLFACPRVPWVYCDSSMALGGDFRDPFLMPDPAATGDWLMYYATRPLEQQDGMLVGLARSGADLTSWGDEKPMWNTDVFHSFSHQIESPALIQHGGLWYLFYTTDSGHPINFETSLDPTADSTGWSNQVHLSTEITTENTDQWFGPECASILGHDYFLAADGDSGGVKIREFFWTDAPHFQFVEPTVAAVGNAVTPARPVSLRLASGGPATRRWTLEVSLPFASRARLDVRDVQGRRVRALADRDFAAGPSRIEWDGRDDLGLRVASGVYFVALRAGAGDAALRLPVVR